MPDRTPADKAERAGCKPPFPRLDDLDCDLLALGRRVGQALGEHAVDARIVGDKLAADFFQLVLPPEAMRATARGNSEGRGEPGPATFSDSAASTSGTLSPLSA